MTHGTESMYRKHGRQGETPCEPCKKAHNIHAKEYYERTKDRRRRKELNFSEETPLEAERFRKKISARLKRAAIAVLKDRYPREFEELRAELGFREAPLQLMDRHYDEFKSIRLKLKELRPEEFNCNTCFCGHKPVTHNTATSRCRVSTCKCRKFRST